MKVIKFILCALLCTSCVSTQTTVNNGCMIYAVNYESRVVKEYRGAVKWTKILWIYYTDKGKPKGHALCVYMMVDRQVYAADANGERMIKSNKLDAMSVGRELCPTTFEAHYEGE